MKKLLVFIPFFIIVLLCGVPVETDSTENFAPEKESVMKEVPSEAQQSVEYVSRELKGCNFLIPRRTVQNINTSSQLRTIQQVNKLLRLFRLKGEEQLCKILQFNSYRQTIKLSSLLCRRGYHIYALRKIVI